MVGYGMAALLCRAFWPASRPSPALGVPGIGVYLWLGLAMSGPVILLRDVSGPRQTPSQRRISPHVGSFTHLGRASWMLIGIYWIVVSLIAIPAP